MSETLIVLFWQVPIATAYVLQQKFKNVKIVTNACRWNLLVGKNGILVVELGELDTKIMFLSSKIKKLQVKMLIFTTVHKIAPEDPLGINIFQKIFCGSYFSPKGTL